MSEEPLPTTAEVVESWKVPSGAAAAGRIRANILAAIDRGFDDPQLVADLAVGPLVVALGQLEVSLADARRRIDELERALGQQGAGSDE
ncbi:hypothetical protein [Nocardia sp. NPDC049707]|uniref:hypothetical protein n=1 Tax=Nocardia sp. NPDC049707 TaxID=3154735 RepID=UPI0034496FF8